MAGYFRNQLNSGEKRELKEIIEQYGSELIPLIAPLVLIRHYVRIYVSVKLTHRYQLKSEFSIRF